MTQTKTVEEETVHGTIEYDVVECDSCGQDVMEEEAEEFVLGEREGVACPMCVEEGPSDFPDMEPTGTPFMAVAMFTVFFPALAAVVMYEAANDKLDDNSLFWIGGVFGGLLWFCMGFYIYNGMAF